MATLKRFCGLLARHKINHISRPFSASSAVLGGYWNKDWQPGPIPRTPEEKASAAKRYGLRPEDYDILADGSAGDYPNLPLVASQFKDPFEDYDFPGIKRNFGEPIHKDYDLIGHDLWDDSIQRRYTVTQMFVRFLMIAVGFASVTYLFNDKPLFLPQMPKQYPFDDLYLEKGGDASQQPGIKHYTFEAAGKS